MGQIPRSIERISSANIGHLVSLLHKLQTTHDRQKNSTCSKQANVGRFIENKTVEILHHRWNPVRIIDP